MTIDTSPEAVAQMLEGVTPGPWTGYQTAVLIGVLGKRDENGDPRWGGFDLVNVPDAQANARFIAYAREAVPVLSAESATLRVQLDATLKDRALILAERDRTFALMLARAETAEAKVIQMTVAWGEDAVRVEALTAEVARLRDALTLTVRADNLREGYHTMPNDHNRIGDKRSKKAHARDAWLRAFRKAAKTARAALIKATARDAGVTVEAVLDAIDAPSTTGRAPSTTCRGR